MPAKFTNNAFGTLASSITNSATTITLTSGNGARFPSLAAGEFFYATLIDSSNNLEIVKVTARATDALTVTRAQDSTTARAYSAGDRIELRPVAAALTNMVQLDGTQTLTGTLTSSGASFTGSWAGTSTFSGNVTFSNTITGSISGNAGTVTDGTYLSTAQTISGVKTFSAAPILNNEVNIQLKDSGGTARNFFRLNNSNNVLIMNSGNGLILVRNQGDTSSLLQITDASGNFIATGNVTAYGSPSDIKLKENIVPLTGALGNVKQLNGYRYNYKGKTDTLIGVIAQEIEPVYPELVYEFTNPDTNETSKAVRYELLTAVLLEAVKELSAKVEALEVK